MHQAIGLYNAGDLVGFVNEYAEDAFLVTPDGSAHGRDAIHALWTREQTSFPDRTHTVKTTVEQGDTIATEFSWLPRIPVPGSCPTGPSSRPPASTSRSRAWS
jgi:ketosteroid isomerase-like protein